MLSSTFLVFCKLCKIVFSLFFKHMDLSENMFAPTVLGMFITNYLLTDFYIPIYELSKNLINQIFRKIWTPHFWHHDARKVVLTPEMWCRPDCLFGCIDIIFHSSQYLRKYLWTFTYISINRFPPYLIIFIYFELM